MRDLKTRPFRQPSFAVLTIVFGSAALAAFPVYGADCKSTERISSDTGSTHVTQCSNLSSLIYPPAAGSHYPVWASYKTYTQPIPAGFWVHNLEHGALVFLYHCDSCSHEIAQLQGLLNTLPVETQCLKSPYRGLLAPDPNLKTRFAVLAWGLSLESDCVDSATIFRFIHAHYNQGREDVCDDGVDLSSKNWCGGAPVIAKWGYRKESVFPLLIRRGQVHFRNRINQVNAADGQRIAP